MKYKYIKYKVNKALYNSDGSIKRDSEGAIISIGYTCYYSFTLGRYGITFKKDFLNNYE